VEKADQAEQGETAPLLPALNRPPGMAAPPTILRYGAQWKKP
jgi:hypothetical protein